MSVVIEAAVISDTQPQCQFFVVRKKRLCRMTVRPGRQYCGEHEPQPPAQEQEIDKRIPCPNDPKHTCYVSKLEKHLTKCNARQVEDPPYIVRNLNAPDDEDVSPRVPLKDVPVEALQLVIEKVNTLYEKYVKATIGTWCPPAEHHAAVAGCIAQADRADSSRRHLRQVSRLMQLAEDEGLVGSDTCYVELGAGKGMLSYYVGRAWCTRGSRVVCVDRASLRHKRDNRLQGCASRLRADLRHLALHRAPEVARAAAVVGLAKHLCGVATDYALRALAPAGAGRRARGALLAACCHHRCERRAYVAQHALQELGVTGEDLDIIFGVVSWATCGDGRSRDRRPAEDGVPAARERDRDVETDTNASERELSLPRHDTSGSDDSRHLNSRDRDERIDKEKQSDTNSDRPTSSRDRDADIIKVKECEREVLRSPDVAVSPVPLAVPAREEIGRRAKALIDYGRVLYLREQGFEARLCHYVPTTESPENVCIVAKRDVA